MSEIEANTGLVGFSVKQACDLLGITENYIRRMEDEFGFTVDRALRGTVMNRVYTTEKIFEIQHLRRERGQLAGLRKPITLSVYVKKGGSAKTSVACNLAVHLQLRGLRVCIIDNDPQGDATSMLGYDPDRTPEELIEEGFSPDLAVKGHFGNLLVPSSGRFQQLTLEEIIKKPYGEYGPHLIPAEESIEDLGPALSAQMHSDLRYGLFIEKSRKGLYQHCDLSKYDVIIFDNNPAGTPLSRNALVASDMLVCPIRFDKFSFRALTRLSEWLQEFEDTTGRCPELVAVPTMYVRNRPVMQRKLAQVQEKFPDNVVAEQLHHSADYLKSLDDNVLLAFYQSKTPANSTQAMREVCLEIYERIVRISEAKEK